MSSDSDSETTTNHDYNPLSDVFPQILTQLSHLDLSDRIVFKETRVRAGGSFGDIIRARYSLPGRGKVTVAIKRLRFYNREDIKILFEKEIYVWSKLKHPNILPLLGFAFDKFSGYPLLVSEWMTKGSAWEYVRSNPELDVTHIVIGIAEGLTYLHEQNVMHSDIKADNVVISDSGDALICDFGCARMIAASWSIARPSSGMKGTARYMAFELFAYLQEGISVGYSKKSDVWAFGMAVYELYMRQRPYHHLREAQIPYAITSRELPLFSSSLNTNPVHNIESEAILAKLCKACWNHNPLDRADMAQVLETLKIAHHRKSDSKDDANSSWSVAVPQPLRDASSTQHKSNILRQSLEIPLEIIATQDPLSNADESPQPSPQKSEYEKLTGQSTQPLLSNHRPHELSMASHQGDYGPTTMLPNTNRILVNQTNGQLTARPEPPITNPPTSTSTPDLKDFRMSLEDPVWKVLPAVLKKKYKINYDEWQNYVIFICFGQFERCLSYDEKPLHIFKKLKDANKNPVFNIKHIRDVRSPIAMAHQKISARESLESSPLVVRTRQFGRGHSHSLSTARPSELHTSPPNPASIGQTQWSDLLYSANEEDGKIVEFGTYITNKFFGHGGASGLDSGAHENEEALASAGQHKSISDISYAVAIYPYMAEQENEFNVVVGDTFVILSRARGWWVVQRDPSGNGIVDTEAGKQGWVPAGCLLETNVPVASAIADANDARASTNSSPPSSPTSKSPILPRSILLTSFPCVALMDYRKKGEEELDLVKDNLLRVFKWYNHWTYVVKEEDGDRGWVPSWIIGKAESVGQALVPSQPPVSVLAESPRAPQAILDPKLRRYGGHWSFSLGKLAESSPMDS